MGGACPAHPHPRPPPPPPGKPPPPPPLPFLCTHDPRRPPRTHTRQAVTLLRHHAKGDVFTGCESGATVQDAYPGSSVTYPVCKGAYEACSAPQKNGDAWVSDTICAPGSVRNISADYYVASFARWHLTFVRYPLLVPSFASVSRFPPVGQLRPPAPSWAATTACPSRRP